LKYPFYGTIHWYVLQQYALELKKLSACKGEGPDGSDNLVNEKCQWLKGVSIEKYSLNPSKSVAESLEVVSPQEVQASLNSAGQKPHFSNHERGGLLLLVQKMKNNLFEQDLPPSIDSASELLCEIEMLLNSKMSDKYSTSEPSGIGILQQNHQPRAKKRMRKYSCGDRKSKIYKECRASISSSEDLYDNCHTIDDVANSPPRLCNTKSELYSNIMCSSTGSTPMISGHSASLPVGEISLAIDAVSSTATSPFSKDNSTTSVVNTMNPVGELLSATSPTPLNTETTIIKVPNPVYK